MDEKLSFVAECLRGELAMVSLCEAYGISRKTGYKWLGRYRELGPEGLVDRSRAPRRHGRSMAPEVADAIVGLRRQRPHWGPRKLRAVLMRESPETVWPAASTMGDLLRSEGLVSSRRRRRRVAAAQSDAASCRGAERCVVHRLQGLVPHPGRGALRSADGDGRLQPLPSGLRDRAAADGGGPCGVGGAVRALRPAGDDPFGQRLALCRHGCGRPVAAVCGLAQGGHCAGADRPGPPAAERAARAHAQRP